VRRDWPDIWGGLILAAVGIGAAFWAGLHYEMGTLRRMGPGLFPVALGLGLGVLGLVIALPAMRRPGEGARFELAPTLCVLAAILIFGLVLQRLGLVGVTFAAVLIATLPAMRKGWLWRVVLALCVTALTVAVFHYGLRMTLPLWPRL
jgi:hypothetical protein